MTDKQRELLEKYLCKDNMQKLSSMSEKEEYNISKSFIDLILHMRWYHPSCEEMCSVPYYECEPSTDEKRIIEELLNRYREEYGLMNDEYAYIKKVCYLDENHKWYMIQQDWFKGMSDTPSSKVIFVKYNKEIFGSNRIIKFSNIYNELFDMKIYSMEQLVKFYFNNSREKS